MAQPQGFKLLYSKTNLLLKNNLANFNQTWQKTCLEVGNSDLFKERGWPLLGPNKGHNKENLINLQKSSSHEPLVRMR